MLLVPRLAKALNPPASICIVFKSPMNKFSVLPVLRSSRFWYGYSTFPNKCQYNIFSSDLSFHRNWCFRCWHATRNENSTLCYLEIFTELCLFAHLRDIITNVIISGNKESDICTQHFICRTAIRFANGREKCFAIWKSIRGWLIDTNLLCRFCSIIRFQNDEKNWHRDRKSVDSNRKVKNRATNCEK